MNNAALITKLEQAKHGSRKLSDGVLLALGHKLRPPTPRHQLSTRGPDPSPTQDLQDAVDLVPEGWRVYTLSQNHHGDLRWYAGIDKVYAAGNVNSGVIDGGPALALCIAILKTIESEDDE